MWFRRAAEQGYAAAQTDLGAMYANGRGVPKNYPEAVKWYRRAAEQGNSISQRCLAKLYFQGLGVPANAAEAVKWYSRAAEQGDPESQANLAAAYEKGIAVKQSYAEAVRLYRLAAEGPPWGSGLAWNALCRWCGGAAGLRGGCILAGKSCREGRQKGR